MQRGIGSFLPIHGSYPVSGSTPATVKAYTEVNIENSSSFGTATPIYNYFQATANDIFSSWQLMYEKTYVTNLFRLGFKRNASYKLIFQIGIGENGSEIVIAEYSILPCGNSGFGDMEVYLFPIKIPANTKVKVRAATIHTSNVYVYVFHSFYKTLESDILNNYSFDDYIKESSSFSSGTDNLISVSKPASANTFSNYYTISEINSIHYLNSVNVGVLTSSGINSLIHSLELAIGSIGSETVFLKIDSMIGGSSSGGNGNVYYLPIPKKFPANTRISARISDSSSNANDYYISCQSLIGL